MSREAAATTQPAIHNFPASFQDDTRFEREALRVFLQEQGLPPDRRAGELSREQLREVLRRSQNLKQKSSGSERAQ